MKSDRPRSIRSLTKAELIEENERLRERLARVEGPGRETIGTEEAERLRHELAEVLEQQTATTEILRVISSSPTDIQVVLATVAERAARLCDSFDAAIFLVDGDTLHRVAHHGPIPPTGSTTPRGRGFVNGRVVLERREIHLADLQAEADEFPEGSAEAQRVGWRTTLAVPLMKENAVLGTIAIRRTEVRPFSGHQIDLLKTFADQAVIAIENVRLFKELGARNSQLTEALEQQTATSEILRVISRSPTDVQPVFDTIVRSAVRLCAGLFSSLYQFDGELIHRVAQHNYPPGALEASDRVFPARPTRALGTGRAILERAIVHMPDVELDPEFRQHALFRAIGIRSSLWVPMLREGAPIGVIGVSRAESGPFSDSEIELLQTFADQAVIAIENVRLFKELEARNRDLTTALDRQTATADVLRIIAQSPTELQPVLDAIATSALRLCAASDAVIERLEGDRFYNAAHAGTQMKGLVGLPLPLTRRFPGGRAVLDRQRVIIDDIHLVAEEEYPDTLELLKLNTIHSVAEIPLVSEGKPLGTIAVLRAEVRPFTDAEVTLLETFADQAVIAIENVRLFTELQASNRDLTTALDTQTATSNILSVISRSQTDVQPVFDAIVRSAARLCHAAISAVFLTDGRLIYHPANYGASPEMLASIRALYPRPLDMESTPGIAILTRSVVHVPDTEDESAIELVRLTGRRIGARSVITVPMLREGEAVGAITVGRREPGRFSDAEVELLKTFADQAVIAVENVRLFTELQEKNRALTESLEQQTATSEILEVISSSPTDIQPVLDAIVESAARLCEANDVLIRRVDDDMMRVVAHIGSVPIVESAIVQPVSPESVGGRSILERRTIHINDVLEPHVGKEYPNGLWTLFRDVPYRTMLVVPLVREDTAIGTIAIRRPEVCPFSDKQIKLLETFADQAVIAIENVRLFTELQEKNRALTQAHAQVTEALEQQTATSEVLKVISRSTFELQPVLETLVENAARLCSADWGVIYRIDREVLRPAAFYLASEEFREFWQAQEVRPGRGSGVGRAALDRRTVHITDALAERDYERTDVQRRGGYRTVLSVPMLRQGVLIGVVNMMRSVVRPFTDKQIELVTTFADQAVIAIENVRLFKELEAANRELAAASQHKSEFLANMSHELRTPLNAIIGFSEVLSEKMFGELNEKQEEYSKDIHASGQHLLSLINDILDLSKIEAGRMELELSDFHLPTALDSALTLVRERAGRRSIALHLSVDERLGQIQADERKVRQVVLNLLSNAIKFTPEGGRIEVLAAPKDGSVEVSVADTGVGIAPEDQEAVFEEFRQVGTADKKVEGTGLGLTLCRKFVELHGGKIWVKSELGKSSTFTFTIPVRHGEHSASE